MVFLLLRLTFQLEEIDLKKEDFSQSQKALITNYLPIMYSQEVHVLIYMNIIFKKTLNPPMSAFENTPYMDLADRIFPRKVTDITII